MDLTHDEILEKLSNGEIRLFEIEKYTKTAHEAADIRREFIENESGVKLEHISKYSIDMTDTAKKNIENPIGTVQIPVGVVGPLVVNCDDDEDGCSALQSDKDRQPAFDEYVKAFSDEIDDILDNDDYLEYYMLTEDDNTFGIKKLKEKWVEVEHYSEIADAASEDDKDCVRDYYIRQMSSNKLYFSLFGLILFALALL